MAEINNEETVPGFTLQSSQFMVKFVAGFQKGLVSNSLEYNTDWMEVMIIILETLEIFPTSVKTVEQVLATALDEWVVANGALNIKTSVKIEEKIYFPPPYGSAKSLTLYFSDNFKTEVLFHIKKKTSMKTLKDLGAAAVAVQLEEEKDIAKLEIPKTLLVDLMKAFKNDFSEKYYYSQINCCYNHKESILNLSQLCGFGKRKQKNTMGPQPQNKKRKVKTETGGKKTKTVKCEGCGKSFKRILSHKCKILR